MVLPRCERPRGVEVIVLSRFRTQRDGWPDDQSDEARVGIGEYGARVAGRRRGEKGAVGEGDEADEAQEAVQDLRTISTFQCPCVLDP